MGRERAREEDDEGFGDERASQRARELRPSRDQAMGRSRGPLASGEDETAWFGHRYALFLHFFSLFLSLVCIFGRGFLVAGVLWSKMDGCTRLVTVIIIWPVFRPNRFLLFAHAPRE